MNYEVPDFQSDIPAHLLTNASPQDKYIMENISILSQKSNWLTQTQKMQNESLDELKAESLELKAESKEIRIQTTKTNGRVSALEDAGKEVKDVMKTYKTAKSIVFNKFFILGSAFAFLVFFVYIAPWIEGHGKAFIPSVINALFS
jgi:hypothetical protein